MDTSKEYIEMCRKAVKIQGLFKANTGDFYYCFCTDIEPTDMFPKGFGLSIITEWDADLNSELIIRSETDIWLPRQDQLQGMVFDLPSFQDPIVLNDMFTEFCHPLTKTRCYDWELEMMAYIDTLKSMEQLWLAFVMLEKFNKKWDGNDWITSDRDGE